MAVNNKFITKSLYGGGSSSGTKKKSTISTSYSDNLLGGGVSNPRVSLPKNLSYRDNLVNLQPVGGAGAGTGGVTNEGVVLGNPIGGGVSNPRVSLPKNLSYRDNLVNLQPVGGAGAGTGGVTNEGVVLGNPIGGGVSNPRVSLPKNLSYRDNLVNLQPVGGAGAGTGGVTNEGVVLGNPNVERMPQIKEKTDTSYSANLLNAAAQQPTAPITYGQQLAAASAQQETPATGTPDTSGGTGTTGSTGSTGGSTAGSGEVDTYEEFLLKQEGFYKEQLDKLNALIEQNKQNALQQAESERGRAVIDARSSYAQNLATYGANAEQLAAMGLSGSGYSDYLNQQAYATQRAETQNANAQAEATKVAAEQQANSDKLNAELSYAENMQGNAEKLAQYQQQKAEEAKAEEEQKKAYYASLLASANTGKYTSEQIASLGAQYGLDEEQISQLQAAVESYEQQKYADNYATILDQMLAELPDYNDDNKFVIKEQDRNKMLEFLEENKGSLGEQLYDFYKKKIDNIEVYSEQAQKDDETAKQEEQQKEEDKRIITGNDSIEYNGKYYRLDSQLDKGANQIVRNNDFKDKLKELGYSDPFDKNIPNGTTIKSNVDNKGANDFNWWDDVGAFLLSPLGAGAWDSWRNWNEITMTYYNGNWYLSSEFKNKGG